MALKNYPVIIMEGNNNLKKHERYSLAGLCLPNIDNETFYKTQQVEDQ